MAELETLGFAIGAGVATLGVTGPALAVGNIGAKMLEGASRQPEHTSALFTNALILSSLAEALGLFSWIVSMLLILKLNG